MDRQADLPHVPDAGPAPGRGDLSPRTAGRRLLIVEDEFLLAMQLEQIVAAAGFEVVGSAGSAAAAIRLAAETRPDLVLMDIRLHGSTDGIEAATEIWRQFGIRCLFVTGNAETARSERGAAANAVGIVTKPYTEEQIVRAVTEGLGESGRH